MTNKLKNDYFPKQPQPAPNLQSKMTPIRDDGAGTYIGYEHLSESIDVSMM